MKTGTFSKVISLICVFVWAITAHGNAQIINTVAGTGVNGYSGDGGPATTAQIYLPAGITFDGLGNYYIADEANNVIRKVNASGIISTIAGSGVSGGGGYSGDGGQATVAELNNPTDLVIDPYGNIYIADNLNDVIRKVDPFGIISTTAGTGVSGYSGDMGPATLAKLYGPTSLVIDATGNLYVADQHNQAVRKIDLAGNISTVAGTGVIGYTGDGGPATNATFRFPTTLAIDKHNNLFISDQTNNCIRKVNSAGIISTVVGSGAVGYSGDGGPATNASLNNVVGVAVDTFGNLYIGDEVNHVIRKVNTSGIIFTIAGIGTQGYSGDGGPATACRLRGPWGAKVDIHGNIFVADQYNHVIRKITAGEIRLSSNVVSLPNVQIYPNPASTELTIEHANGAEVVIYDVVGRAVKRVQINGERQVMDISILANGVYVLQISKDGEKRNVRVVKE